MGAGQNLIYMAQTVESFFCPLVPESPWEVPDDLYISDSGEGKGGQITQTTYFGVFQPTVGFLFYHHIILISTAPLYFIVSLVRG